MVREIYHFKFLFFFFFETKNYISIFLLMVISSHNMYIGPGREIDNAFRGKYKLPNDLKNTRTLPNLH